MRDVRVFAEQAFSRAAGAPLIKGNSVRLLKNASENYPAWLNAIQAAKYYVHMEIYFILKDDTGQLFADALIAKAREGVRVRLIYDWMGCFGKTSKSFWNHLLANNIEVRCYNPPCLESPFGWLSRDHRKMLSIDGQVGFVTGLCIGRMWVGVPEKRIEPWRDTGIELHGPSVADIEQAFAKVWAMTGDPIPDQELVRRNEIASAGKISLRIVTSEPANAGLFRLDQLITALAKKRLWLTDAYYAGTNIYVQALRAAVNDGVDVRLLVPNGTDIPILKPLSRAGYRLLLESGVRVFEWNGTMLHAKTAVADGCWARVGSTNLNIASWFGNCEMDVMVEDEIFAQEMEEMFLQDLSNSTEVILDSKQKVRKSGEPRHSRAGGRVGLAVAGAVRIGNTIGAAFTNRRILEPVEAHLTIYSGVLLLILAIIFAVFPRIPAYFLLIIFIWLGVSLLYRSFNMHREGKRKRNR
jgi:cardiolipin synthase A/B